LFDSSSDEENVQVVQRGTTAFLFSVTAEDTRSQAPADVAEGEREAGPLQSQWAIKGAAVQEANCRIHQMRAFARCQQKGQAPKHEAHGQQKNVTTAVRMIMTLTAGVSSR